MVAETVVRIPLTKGFEATVDAADMHLLDGYKWYASIAKGGKAYAVAAVPGGTRKFQKRVKMHRLLMGCPPCDVDHKDGNSLNNRRHNLRLATVAQNQMNRGANRNSRSQLKGVNRRSAKWQAEIQFNGRKRYIGSFATKEEAALAYDRAASELFGEFAKLNFPETVQRPGGVVSVYRE